MDIESFSMTEDDQLKINSSPRIRIRRPEIKSAKEDKLWKEAQKYARLIPFEPEPNMGRVREIKEALKRGDYLESEMVEDAAAQLAIRFIKKEGAFRPPHSEG